MLSVNHGLPQGPFQTSVMTPNVPSLPKKMRVMSYPADDFFARERVHMMRPSERDEKL
jgi:hypothetical protein